MSQCSLLCDLGIYGLTRSVFTMHSEIQAGFLGWVGLKWQDQDIFFAGLWINKFA